jgi:cytoskeletal protein CcmA (bactofilin family)
MTMPIEASKTPKQTVLEEGTEFKGTLKSSCPVVINGTIDGEIDAPELTVTRSGSVAGSLRATKLRSQGTLSGKVEASDVYLSGVVRSNTSIKAKRLEVRLGSDQAQIEVTFGECALEVGDAISEPLAVAPPARADNTRSDGARADNVRADNVRTDNVRTDNARSENARAETAAAPLDVTATDGWGQPVAEPSATPVSAAPQGNGNVNRSPWKPSRSIEVGDSAKSTSR